MRMLLFELDGLWALAAELVAAAELPVLSPVVVVACVSKTPAADREESWAELKTNTTTPSLRRKVDPWETKGEVVV
jgi:hypothetical protein